MTPALETPDAATAPVVDRDRSPEPSGLLATLETKAEARARSYEHLFDRSALMPGLRSRTTRGMAWTLSGQWTVQVITILTTVVLARRLTPGDYGIVGMATAFTLFADQFKSFGLSEAVVQRERLTHEQVSALFWINVGISLALTVGVAGAAPALAAFFHQPQLLWVTIALSTTFLISGLGVQHDAILLRRMEFRAVATRTIANRVAISILSIGCALLGFGYWSLVIGLVGGSVVWTVMTWSAVRWRPSRPCRPRDVGELVGFGAGVSVTGLLSYVGRNADNVIVGRVLGAASLGIYSRAYSLLMLPLQTLTAPVANVAQPALAALRNDGERFKKYFLSAISGLAYVGLPIICLLVVLGRPIILLLLGPQWVESIPVFQFLAIAGFLQLLSNSTTWLFVATGRSWQMARWAMIRIPITVAAFLIGVHWGTKGVAASYAIIQIFLLPLACRRALAETPITVRAILTTLWRPFLLAAEALAVGFLVNQALGPVRPIIQILVTGTSVVVAVIGTGAAWPGVRRDLMALRKVRAAKAAT